MARTRRGASSALWSLVFKIEMEAGHGGRSGRYDRYRNQALTYAFLLSNVE